jgi:RNA polymerase-binding transcription factor DksA
VVVEVDVMDRTVVERLLDHEERRWQQARRTLLGEHVQDQDERDWVGELDRAGQHPADLASETAEREIDVSLLHEADTMLQEVRDAQARLEHGTYGVCQTCGHPIPEARLRLVPATRHCVLDERAAETHTTDDRFGWASIEPLARDRRL